MPFELKKDKPTRSPKSPYVSLRLTIPEDQMLRKTCYDLGLSRADFLRLCIMEYYQKHG